MNRMRLFVVLTLALAVGAGGAMVTTPSVLAQESCDNEDCWGTSCSFMFDFNCYEGHMNWPDNDACISGSGIGEACCSNWPCGGPPPPPGGGG